MKVISLLQPWASLCVNIDPVTGKAYKQIETRSWNTKYRGPLLIHASLSKKYLHLMNKHPFAGILPHSLCFDYQTGKDMIIPMPEMLPLGSIIGRVDLVDICDVETIKAFNHWGYGRESAVLNEQELAFGDYSPGRYGWMLANPVLFDRPIPAKGKPGLWEYKFDGDEFLKKVDDYVSNKESKFQLQYVDYENDQWTLPVLLTAERADRFKKDASIKKIRIIWRSESFEIEKE